MWFVGVFFYFVLFLVFNFFLFLFVCVFVVFLITAVGSCIAIKVKQMTT